MSRLSRLVTQGKQNEYNTMMIRKKRKLGDWRIENRGDKTERTEKSRLFTSSAMPSLSSYPPWPYPKPPYSLPYWARYHKSWEEDDAPAPPYLGLFLAFCGEVACSSNHVESMLVGESLRRGSGLSKVLYGSALCRCSVVPIVFSEAYHQPTLARKGVADTTL